MYNLILSAGEKATEPSNAVVVLIGIGVVFAGLVCIIMLCKVVGWICSGMVKSKEEPTPVAAPVAQTAKPVEQPIENRQQIIAAVSAAVAEELGTDVSAIRILSFKKI